MRSRSAQASVFSSNFGCVTSSRAKDTPDRVARFGRNHWDFCHLVARRELVCAVTGDTSQDSAGTQPASGHPSPNSTDKRHPVGRSQAKRHHHSANELGRGHSVPGGKNISASHSLRFTLLQAFGDQGDFTPPSRSGLDPERGRQMALAYAPKRNGNERRADRLGEKRFGRETSEKCSGIRENSCASIREFVSQHRPIRPPFFVRSRNPPRLSKGWKFSLSG